MDTAAKTPGKTGRIINAENLARLEHIKARLTEEPGVSSADLAREMKITSLSCSQLGDRLVKKGEVVLRKLMNGQRTYYPAGATEKDFLPDLSTAKKAEL